VIHTSYNGYLVGLSILIASLAGYVALDLSGRVTVSRGRSRIAWIAGSAAAMGIGIWSMHFVGMLALRVPLPIKYDVPLVGLSVLIAVGGSAVTFLMSARTNVSARQLALASLFMGPAIAGMHYTGMAAMRMPARITYDPFLFRLSIAIAVVVSFVALQLAVRLRVRETVRGRWLKIAAAALMGAAVYGMHYTGMLAATFSPDANAVIAGRLSVLGSHSLAAAVAVTTLMILAIALTGSIVDRRIKARSAEAEALRESEELLRAVIDDSPIAIIATDLELNVTRWNPAAEALLGWRAAEIIGRPYHEIVPEERLGEQVDLQDAALRGRATTHLQTVHRRKDGSPVDVGVSLAVLRDHESHANGFVFLLADETARKQLEARVRQSERMEAVGQLAGGVAHDFNNLLTAIHSYSEFLLADLDAGDRRREDVVAIQEAAAKAAGLTKQLLAFSRQQVRKPQMLSMNALISDISEMVRRLIPSDIRVTLELAEDLGEVNADPSQLEQVVVNLLVNARDALPAGGEILVRTANATVGGANETRLAEVPPGEYVMLCVRDHGTGMPPEVLARIFEPFFTTKPPGKGTGLGLATVYGVVQQNEGHITVESVPGEGSTFRVYFPRINAPARLAEPATVARSIPRGSETILLVEDNDMVLAAVRRTLTRAGYRVLEAKNGTKAIQVYDQNAGAIDLVITDLVMPEMGGYDLERVLRSRDPGVRVLFISGYSKESLARPATVPEGSVYLAKPFTAEELCTHVREALDIPPILPIAALRARQEARDTQRRARGSGSQPG
jgi:PAS domain S-box-containing protein